MNNELAVGSEHRCDEIPSMDSAPGEVVDTSPMDFDDWAVDPFSLSKEGDMFSSLSAGVEEVVEAHSNLNPSDFVSENAVTKKDSTALNDDGSSANQKSDSQSLEENSLWPSSKKSTNSGAAGSGVNLKNPVSGKKKSEYIPVSRRKKKPKGMPKRPLSAYNLYFQAERTKIIAHQQEGNGPRIGFEGLGKVIGKQWRDLTSEKKKEYGKLAEKDSERYRKEMDAYHERKAKRFAEEDRRAAAHTPVLSGFGSSTQGSSLDPIFAKQPESLRALPGGEMFGRSGMGSQHPESMVSTVSSLPPGSSSISYRPIQIEQAPTPPRHALQHGSILDSLDPRPPRGIVRADPSPHYFPQPAAANSSEPLPYDAVPPGSGAAILARNNNNCPMPAGMEVVLADRHGVERKYSVQYTCYSMTRENANKYIESITRGTNSSSTVSNPRPWPPPPQTTGLKREYGDQWGVI
mmetsp:Transcript_16459/g.41299  ORF Transcript_16459/g.41299 Transcript_16459/m.41299 type:complete len:462 (+) Transcript_16459:193-1578(+)|eukprot:CAMPEP_0116100806 /NCGR_PEP_ID=MMETSP0327-20121206/12476_1 /TAXON_ID=44447 /ORGANISM="Pseudo-nitzschia delicatissima, Strain B596" /LENGTH=461 /DNA_ID=CAMNT_0003592731 /DNA_START=172 /DNA_END=1557 /DNA_ORIENTATION=-